jgi:hypothetical protein
MRQLPHFPAEMPDEPLWLRRIFLPPGCAPRIDQLVPLDLHGQLITAQGADALLRNELTISRAHGIRTVWDVVQEQLGIERFRIGEWELAQVLLPELPSV